MLWVLTGPDVRVGPDVRTYLLSMRKAEIGLESPSPLPGSCIRSRAGGSRGSEGLGLFRKGDPRRVAPLIDRVRNRKGAPERSLLARAVFRLTSKPGPQATNTVTDIKLGAHNPISENIRPRNSTQKETRVAAHLQMIIFRRVI